MALTTPTTTPRADPARSRGLRRSRDLMVAMPEVDVTSMPAPLEPVHLLALLIRERAARFAAGELKTTVPQHAPFKALIAELESLRELAAAGHHGGTILTSMVQLVFRFAKLKVAWDTSGDRFEVRDRYQTSVRAHLRLLERVGVLRVRVGVDLAGEERRTELVLLPPPEVSVEELQHAAEVLAGWHAIHGPQLNTSATRRGTRDAIARSRPLTASEIQRRGCERTRQRAAAVRREEASHDGSAPPCGTSASLRKNTSSRQTKAISVYEPTANASDHLAASAPRTGTHTRTSAHKSSNGAAAPIGPRNNRTAGSEESPRSGERSVGSQNAPESRSDAASEAVWDPEAIVARVTAAQAQRASVLARIAEQAHRRALEVAGWSLDREWPAVRIREAFVVSRWGASTAADSGPATAGPLSRDHYVRLRRAVARWERNASARPKGWPAGGLAALLHLGTLSALGELGDDAPRLLGYAIGRLDQLSRRLKALAASNSATHHARARQRAHRRREIPPTAQAPDALTLTFRGQREAGSSWPPLLLLPGHTTPSFSPAGELLLNPRLVNAGMMDNPSLTTRLAIRDAYLLAGRRLPLMFDGSAIMAARHRGLVERPGRPRPVSLDELELRELAHCSGEPIEFLRRLSPTYRQAWLITLRQKQAARSALETRALKDALAQRPSNRPRGPWA